MVKSNIQIKIEEVDISKIKPNPNNPRIIKDEKFNKLVESIKSFPDMLHIRPIVVNENNEVLGGNMRLKALHHLKYDKVPVIRANKLTEEQKKEFIIKDNVGFGEWNWGELANAWDSEKLEEWGLDLPDFESYNDINYSEKNKEIDFDDLKDEIEMKLIFNQDEFNFINSELSKISSSKENAILKLINYESSEV